MAESLEKPRRGDKRERTRAALIAAAWAIVDEKGFGAASLEEIARRAGMTRGAIYSNFPSRSDLMLAMASARGLSIDRDFSRPGTLKAQLREFAEGLIATLPDARGAQRWHAEFMVHIAADPGLREHIASGFSAVFDKMAAQFRGHHGESLAIDAHSLALAVQSLAMGFVYQAILSPEAVPPTAVIEAFEALADGALRKPG
ncbi:MAG TPA: TetR/AcrR family transcriptional regulator [Phenylobacterium sp.]|jgi:AcrR family transcriptional regulator|nr:TetR/AcrR family transcriptional regulator [Phenylobacterium sp.]